MGARSRYLLGLYSARTYGMKILQTRRGWGGKAQPPPLRGCLDGKIPYLLRMCLPITKLLTDLLRSFAFTRNSLHTYYALPNFQSRYRSYASFAKDMTARLVCSQKRNDFYPEIGGVVSKFTVVFFL